MVAEPEQLSAPADTAPLSALEALAAGASGAASAETLDEALDALVAATATALGVPVVLARILAPGESAAAVRAVACASPALAAEVAGSRLPLKALPSDLADEATASAEVKSLAERAGASALLQLAVSVDGNVVGALEVLRPAPRFSEAERLVARVAAAQLAAAVRAFRAASANGDAASPSVLEIAGEALVAGADQERTAEEIARLAAAASGARAAVVWRSDSEGIKPVGAHGAGDAELAEAAREHVARALNAGQTVSVEQGGRIATLRLGEPPVHALELFFDEDAVPSADTVDALASFAVRAAYALRASERARTRSLELERTRELLTLTARMNAELSMTHRLDTALDRVAELLGVARVGVYLQEASGLVPAAVRGLDGPHVEIAERLLELMQGPFRTRTTLTVPFATGDPHFAGLEAALEATGIEAAVAVPLVVQDEVTGLLAVYGWRGRPLAEHEEALLTALGAQLAVALDNARLHERATRLGSELENVLALERASASRLAAHYEISRSFVQSLAGEAAPVDATLRAIVRTVVELIGVDAGVIRMPDARRELLVPRALHIADDRLESALRGILSTPQPLEKLPGRRLFQQGKPFVLDPQLARGVGGAHELLVPFLEKGATAVVLPIATAGELLGTMKLLSLDASRPITDEAVEIGLSVAAQAALAIENARLYEHQKYFTESMQRSLLPSTLPDVPGFRLGAIYASSAHVELGGDVYDYMLLPGGRLAVVLGDVMGHGVEAAADMAMAKFVFRSLAREHSAPHDFLAAANEVVCDEIAPGKFITLLYLTVDPEGGEVACASAGHPAPRVVLPDGTVKSLGAGGLALGIEPDQAYEELQEAIEPGTSVVLYTDGVIEARRAGQLYGAERLDELLRRRSDLRPQDLAAAVIADCRAFAGGDLRDDCAVVVIQRTAG
jgi:serine phosphatase RsbU (regulator of sigma subunit)